MAGRKRSTRQAVRAAPAQANADEASALHMDATLSIHEVGAEAGRLRVALASGAQQIDVSALKVVDTAGLQLLLCAVAAARAAGQRLEIRGAGVMFRSAVSALGLGGQFALVPTGDS